MKRAFDFLACALLFVFIVLLFSLTWWAIAARHATKQAERDELQLAPKVAAALDSIKTIEKSTSDVEQATYASEAEIANLADTMNGIAAGLAAHEEAQLKAAQDVSLHVNKLLAHADLDVTELGNTERAATDAINGLAADSHATLDHSQAMLAAAAAQISNPAIAESISDIRDSAESTKQSTADLAAIAADGRKVSDHYTQQVLKPVSKAKRALMVTSGAIGSFVHSVIF